MCETAPCACPAGAEYLKAERKLRSPVVGSATDRGASAPLATSIVSQAEGGLESPRSGCST